MDEKMLAVLQESVVVDKEYCFALIGDSNRLEMLLNALWMGAELSYDGKTLRFDDKYIEPIMKTISPFAYNEKLKELQEEKNAATND